MIILHPDRNVSPAEFRNLNAMGKLHVTRVFPTIQGEGPYAGHPAVFVRLSGCNLGAKRDCPWCDTEFSLGKGQQFTVESVFDQINKHLRKTTKLIVVTGGEPLLQWAGIRQVIALMDIPDNNDLVFQFESNGLYMDRSIIQACEMFKWCRVEFVISPKIPVVHGQYGMLPDWWFEPPARWIISLKYVVSDDQDDNYNDLPPQIIHKAIHEEPLPDVYVSGMTVYDDREEEIRGVPNPTPPTFWRLSPAAVRATEANYRHAAQLAMTFGFRLSYQTHLLSGLE